MQTEESTSVNEKRRVQRCSPNNMIFNMDVELVSDEQQAEIDQILALADD